ncbi:B12-binding domain-containing radical SAM protein [Hespellia stercorisuis]|uniref:Radical SAM superfamily enzyme YgiQ, UPF0313 family n=1 Tax=Hespellia stercorisuis DSM 15480 TaxID=1121950 RepID=A0A1M6J211_9FIRM|nr:B12-binding domain-containing radical SAM protein [Hespellia stercorisuis]SHJ40716.1 Radical SAM superfamily enzyme YgiQ, UPF0313 family [Hespellia stercorisuis DSM 15480]
MKTILTAINAKYIHSNLAVYCLRAYAREYAKETGDVIIAEYTINQQVDDILMDLYKQQPDVLCFSCYLWNISYVEELITEISKILPGTVIWVGGPEVSYNAVEVLERMPQITGVMVGEGEETFSDLMRYYNGSEVPLKTGHYLNGLAGIAGIVYRSGDGAICENELRPVIDLSTVPFVYHDMEEFRNKIIYYETSRGCPFSCSYCLSSIDKCLRFRDVELVKKELQFFIDNEVPQVKFVDRTFNCRHDHAMAVWSYIAEHDRGITNFHFEVAADLLNEEELSLIETMRPGLIQLEIGIQSTNEQTIEEIHRTMKFEKVAEIVKRINRARNVHQHLDLIAGLPYENYESFGRSFNDVYALQPEQLQLGFLKVLKGSYMGTQAERYELLYQTRPPFEVLATRWLPYPDVMRLKGLEDMVEVYYNSRQFTQTMPILERAFDTPFSLYEDLAAYYEEQGLNMVNHSRVARYQILFDFAILRDAKNREMYREALTFDLYLRDNLKNRPELCGELTVMKEESRMFYEEEAQDHRYLPGYEGFDKNQLRKMTHLERIGGKITLFDYRNRNPLDNQARTVVIG